jgi:putative transposase
MLVVRQFLESLIEKYGKHSIYLDGGTWYPEACRKVLKLKHYIDSSLEKSLIERVIKYFKYRLNLLMIIIQVIVKEIVIIVMCITG